MTAGAGPLWALALLLTGAGAAKVARPHDTVRALAALGPRVPATLVRAGAAAEVVVGGWCLLAGGRWAAALLAASYGAFAVFVAVALVADAPIGSCGCFGEPDTPPTVAHLAVCLGAVAVGAAGAASGAGGLPAALAARPGRAPALVLLVGATAYAGYLLLTAAPRLAARRAVGRAAR